MKVRRARNGIKEIKPTGQQNQALDDRRITEREQTRKKEQKKKAKNNKPIRKAIKPQQITTEAENRNNTTTHPET